MPIFEYAAVDASGAKVHGRSRARDELELDRDLEARGLVLGRTRTIEGAGSTTRQRLSQAELLALTTQLATVSSAGVPLVEGLAGIGHRLESERARTLVADLVLALEAGASLSDAMARHPRAFPAVYRASARAGEASGALDTVLDRMAKYLEWSRGMRASTVQALVYPAILLVALAGLVTVLLTYVLPRIEKLFPGGPADLPVETRCVLAVSEFLRAGAVPLLVFGGAAVCAAAYGLRTARGRSFLDARLLGLPHIGTMLRQIATSKFASTASTLHAAGCDVSTVLDVAGETCGNSALRAAFARVAESVRRGSTIADGLEREPEIDSLLKQMVGVGEKTGELDGCLARLVAYYDDEIPRALKRFLTFFEPLLLLAAGGIVAFILLAALMPIFRLYENLG